MRDRNSFGLGEAIERNSEALKGIIADLFAMLGLDDDDHGFADFRIPSIAPCCGCSARPNPPCGA